MSKESRVVVRMSPDLLAWIMAEAGKRELDNAAFVRMVLAERRGVAPTVEVVTAQGARIEDFDHRGVVETACAAVSEPAPAQESSSENDHPIDVDAIVASGIEEAERAGLTEERGEPTNDDYQQSGVRPLRRPVMPYSPKAQPSWIT